MGVKRMKQRSKETGSIIKIVQKSFARKKERYSDRKIGRGYKNM